MLANWPSLEELINFKTPNPFLARAYPFWLRGMIKLVDFRFTGHWDPLAANAVGSSDTISIDPSIDFCLCQLSFVAYPTTGDLNTPISSPNMLLELTEKSSTYNFQDEAHHVGLWTGSNLNGHRSYSLAMPRLIKGNNEILAKLTDLGNTASEAWLGLEGFRIEYVNTDRHTLFPAVAF